MNIQEVEKIAQSLTLVISHAAQAYGPQVVSSVFEVTKLQSIGWVIQNLFGLLIFLIVFVIGLLFLRSAIKDNDMEINVFLAALFMVAGGLPSILLIANLLDIWLWVGIFNPKIYLVHELISKMLNH